MSAAAAAVVTKATMGERLWFTCGEEAELDRHLAKPVVGILLSNFSLTQLGTWFDEREIVPVIEAVARMVRQAMQDSEEQEAEENGGKSEDHEQAAESEASRDDIQQKQVLKADPKQVGTDDDSVKDALGNQLWSASQKRGMDSGLANKVVGIILSSFTVVQITAWYENGQIEQVLEGVAAKVRFSRY